MSNLFLNYPAGNNIFNNAFAFSLFLFCLFCQPYSAAGKEKQTESVIRTAYRQLKEQAYDPEKIARVKNLTLQRDRGTIYFEDGTFYFAQPALGRGQPNITLLIVMRHWRRCGRVIAKLFSL